jgi:hypothetical protein
MRKGLIFAACVEAPLCPKKNPLLVPGKWPNPMKGNQGEDSFAQNVKYFTNE